MCVYECVHVCVYQATDGGVVAMVTVELPAAYTSACIDVLVPI